MFPIHVMPLYVAWCPYLSAACLCTSGRLGKHVSLHLTAGAQAKLNTIDGGGTRDAAACSARRGRLGGLRDSGANVCPSPEPERCPSDREIGYAGPREHQSVPP